MIKRRFYRFEHGDKDAPSESSSSSDSEVEAESTEESEREEEENEVEGGDEEEAGNDDEDDEIKVKDKKQSLLTSSGYESEDSSANEFNLDSSGLPISEDDTGNQHAGRIVMDGHLSGAGNAESFDIQHNTASIDDDLGDYVLRCKSVYKCRICPRIVCLTKETLQAHLKSKKHARSEKLLKEGRLKLMLNDAGKVEGDDSPQKKPDIEEEEDTPFTTKQKRKRMPRIADKWLRRNKFSRKHLAKMGHLNDD